MYSTCIGVSSRGGWGGHGEDPSDTNPIVMLGPEVFIYLFIPEVLLIPPGHCLITTPNRFHGNLTAWSPGAEEINRVSRAWDCRSHEEGAGEHKLIGIWDTSYWNINTLVPTTRNNYHGEPRSKYCKTNICQIWS